MINPETLSARNWSIRTLMFMALLIGGPLARVWSFATMMTATVLTGKERAGDHA